MRIHVKSKLTKTWEAKRISGFEILDVGKFLANLLFAVNFVPRSPNNFDRTRYRVKGKGKVMITLC